LVSPGKGFRQASRGGGIQTPSQNSRKTVGFGQGGAKSDALAPESTSINPALATIIDAWPVLPDVIRAGILVMVRAGSR
jgi:hypothetical protein